MIAPASLFGIETCAPGGVLGGILGKLLERLGRK